MRKIPLFFLILLLVTVTQCQNPGEEAPPQESSSPSGITQEQKDAARNAFYAAYPDFRCVDSLESFSGTENPSFPVANAYGPPAGSGENAGSLDVFMLGTEKEVVFRIAGKVAANGAGDDLVIYENGFKTASGGYYMEPGFVEVSPDGINWYGFSPAFGPDSPDNETSSQYNELTGKTGMAGLYPVVINYLTNPIDPSMPSAGGDRLNLDNAKKITDRSSTDPITYTYGNTLAADGFFTVKFVKIIDGNASASVKAVLTADGNPRNGMDLDAICIFHTQNE